MSGYGQSPITPGRKKLYVAGDIGTSAGGRYGKVGRQSSHRHRLLTWPGRIRQHDLCAEGAKVVVFDVLDEEGAAVATRIGGALRQRDLTERN
jgi:hypothetical protein